MRNFFRWLIYNVFYQSPYCAKCGACGDDIGCGCHVNCKGGLFCIHPHLTQYALDGANAPSSEQDTGLESDPANEVDTQPRK